MLACAALALALAACGRDERLELTAQMPLATLWRETASIDLGTAAARPHLLLGWDIDENWHGTSMVWAQDERSLLSFYVATPRPLTLRMRGGPLVGPDVPQQTVDVAVNGTAIGQWQLAAGQHDYALPIPASALRPRENVLELRYAYARRPSNLQRGSTDTRRLAVAWDWLTFDGLDERPAPAVQAAAGADAPALTLPVGTEVGFFFDLPDGATLQFDAVTPLPTGANGAAALEVLAERDGQAPTVLTVAAASPPAAWQTTLPGGGPTRIGLRAVGAADAAGVAVVAPRLLVRRRAAAACDAARPPAADAVPVLLYVVDTLRADHLGSYGYGRPTSPHLDAFAADAVRFANGVAQSSWTRPSVASIMTGLNPPRHGATGLHSVLPPLPTLAGLLAEAGYDTAGRITNSLLDAHFGFAQGFASYQTLSEIPIAAELGARPNDFIQQTAADVLAAARPWLDSRDAGRPPFLYLHVTDPHNPYLPPSPFREALAADADLQLGLPLVLQDIVAGRLPVADAARRQLIDLYDADIASMDDGFGALVAELRARGLYDRALIVVTADHGEAFGSHGYYEHMRSLYAEMVHVPLLVKFPQQWRAGSVVSAPARQVDILPTVLDVLGIDPPAGLDGSSLLPALSCPDAPRPPAYVAVGGSDLNPKIDALVAGRHKLIHTTRSERAHPRLELYDLVDDPGEQRDLAPAQPVLAGYLFSRLPEYRDAPAAGAAVTVTPDAALEERMRALGYLK